MLLLVQIVCMYTFICGCSFSSSHFWMWELDLKEGWTPNIGCFQILLLGKTFQSPLDSKELKTVKSKGNQPWILTGRDDAEAEVPVLWPPNVNSQSIGKNPDAGKDWRWEEKGMTEDEMVGWHHWFNGHEFEQAPGDGEGQESLVCCSPWGHEESDTIMWLNNNSKISGYSHTL